MGLHLHILSNTLLFVCAFRAAVTRGYIEFFPADKIYYELLACIRHAHVYL